MDEVAQLATFSWQKGVGLYKKKKLDLAIKDEF